jgi:hypothetical protein
MYELIDIRELKLCEISDSYIFAEEVISIAHL